MTSVTMHCFHLSFCGASTHLYCSCSKKPSCFQLRRYYTRVYFWFPHLFTCTFTSKQSWTRAEVQNRLQAHKSPRTQIILLPRAGKTNYHKLKVRQVRQTWRKTRDNKTAYMLSKSKHSISLDLATLGHEFLTDLFFPNSFTIRSYTSKSR